MLPQESFALASSRGARGRLHPDYWWVYYGRFLNRKMGFAALA